MSVVCIGSKNVLCVGCTKGLKTTPELFCFCIIELVGETVLVLPEFALSAAHVCALIALFDFHSIRKPNRNGSLGWFVTIYG